HRPLLVTLDKGAPMRTYPLTISLVLGAALAFASLSSAQTTPTPPTPGGHGHGLNGHGLKAQDPTTQSLLSAFNSLKSALPIYDGDRVRAMRLIEWTHKAIKTGANPTPKNAAGTATGGKTLPQVKSEGHDKSKYTAQQVQASQAAM